MENVVNITDKLIIRNLESRISRMDHEINGLLKEIYALKTERFSEIAKNDRLKQEIDELKKLLKAVDVGITYG